MSTPISNLDPARLGAALFLVATVGAGSGLPVQAGLPVEAGLPVGAPVLRVQEEPVALRLEARPGDTATYRFQQQIDLQMPPELGGDQQVDSRLVVQHRVERVDDESIQYLAEVRDVGVEMEASAMTGDLDFSRFKGQRFRMTLSRRGELREMEPVGEAGPGAEQLQQSMRQVGFPVLPARPVGVGDTWVDTTRVDAAAMALPAQGEIVSVNRATLKRLVRAGDATVAELAVETSFRFEPGSGAMPGMEVQVTGNRSDTVRFDVTRGRFLTSSGIQEFEMRMAIPGATGALSIKGTARSRAELLTGS